MQRFYTTRLQDDALWTHWRLSCRLEVEVIGHQVVLLSNQGRVSKPLGDLMRREAFDPVSGARCPEVLEEPWPWLVACPPDDLVEAGSH
jgi:hypothetical protein